MDNITSLTDKINEAIGNNTYYYVANFIDHAQGLEKWITNFQGISLWNSPYLNYLKDKGVPVFCFVDRVEQQPEVKSAAQILDFMLDNRLIDFYPESFFQTFKISSRFSSLVEKIGGKLLNSSDDLNRLFESKVSQAELFDKFGISFPKTMIVKLKDMMYEQVTQLLGDTFVVQFNRGHTGNGTIFVKTKEQYFELQRKFPHRILRISEFISSPTYTINACATKYGIYLSGLCRQISGIPELASDEGGTVGNNYAHGLTNIQIWSLMDEIKKLGKALREHEYKGLFGLDFMFVNDRAVILEINARQTMSVPFNSLIQEMNSQVPIMLIHIAEFLGIEYDIDLQSYNMDNVAQQEVAQLILRNKSNKNILIDAEIKSGEYSIEQGTLVFRNPGLFIDRLGKSNILLILRASGTLIGPGEEMARIQVKKNLYKDINSPDYQYVNILTNIEKSITG